MAKNAVPTIEQRGKLYEGKAKIVFATNRGNRNIYVMNANGSNQTNLTRDAYDDSLPDWQALRPTPPPKCRVPKVVGLRLATAKTRIPEPCTYAPPNGPSCRKTPVSPVASLEISRRPSW